MLCLFLFLPFYTHTRTHTHTHTHTHTTTTSVFTNTTAAFTTSSTASNITLPFRRQMVKMMITVVVIYAICWLPLHTITLVGDSYDEVYSYPYIHVIWTACHWLAMSNSCYNPIVYCWMNSRYRNGFQRLHTYVTTMRSTAPGDRMTSRKNPAHGSPYSQRRRKSSGFSTTEQISL